MKYAIENNILHDSGWFSSWFDSLYYHELYANRNEKEAKAFINELVMKLQPPPGSLMLDLGCGSGRHSKQLAAKGFIVTGLDLAASSIRQAKRSECSNLQFYRHDMREPFGRNQFDYVFNFFTSFGYFRNEDENQKVIHNISHSLKNGGYCLIDYINTPCAEKNLVKKEVKEIDGVCYQLDRWMDEYFFYKKIAIEDLRSGEPAKFIEQVAKFYLDDFDYMLEKEDLYIENVFGDYFLNEYDSETSSRLMILAKKQKPARTVRIE